jgi:glycosyltransferase involved in cell wall biosynthesis
MISHSRLCAAELQELYGIAAEKIATIHPPADVARFKLPVEAQRLAARRKLGLPSDRVVFAFPSSGHKRKGLYPLIEALKPFGGRAVLGVTGKPPGNVPEFVRHLGYVDDIADLYVAADFTAMASYYEPFGQVGVESVLCGTRVVFEENMGCLEVITGDAALRFNVWQPATISRALATAIELAAAGKHRLMEPLAHLKYDPSVEHHVSRVMEVLEGESFGRVAA